MSRSSGDDITELITSVRSSQKYAAISGAMIRSIGLRELAARRNLKEAIKATKNKLHQVAGAYLDARLPYDDWLALLEAAVADDRRTTNDDESLANSKLRQACREIMRHHASTRERLPILESFYASTLASLGPVRSVLDLACGLNPLALPWMPLAPDARYYACDVYADMIALFE
nr:Ribosomal RNA methyltransferase (FmrO) [uncultured bacterium]